MNPTLVAVFGSNSEMYFDGSKQVPIWTYLYQKKFKIPERKIVLLSVKEMVQNHVLSNVSCWVGRSENLICPSKSPWNEDAKIGIGLICS